MLNNLTILCIAGTSLRALDFTDVIIEFADRKWRSTLNHDAIHLKITLYLIFNLHAWNIVGGP